MPQRGCRKGVLLVFQFLDQNQKNKQEYQIAEQDQGFSVAETKTQKGREQIVHLPIGFQPGSIASTQKKAQQKKDRKIHQSQNQIVEPVLLQKKERQNPEKQIASPYQRNRVRKVTIPVPAKAENAIENKAEHGIGNIKGSHGHPSASLVIV